MTAPSLFGKCTMKDLAKRAVPHMLYWDGTGLVMAYKRLEDTSFTWPAVRDGLMTLNHAQFEALFSGLDWRKVKALEVRTPAAAE
ncbi:IS66 family insertion sequence element accessory protein TnpB [Brucella thiophenivorans]|nr:IS66 family insertion sequence element accessory protein TnpB [Brucella thiophenivorans]